MHFTKADKTSPSPSRKKRTKYIDGCALPQSAEDGLLHGGGHDLASSTTSDVCSLISIPNEKIKDADIEIAKNLEERKMLPSQTDSDPPPTKKKRQWEQWSIVDKDYFFEAVAVHGKDFESITSAIAQKQRKKGCDDCVPRTKDQVRHLYYRTWAMISKLIDAGSYPVNINKAFQELYAVINFGEIRKKLGGSLKKKGIEKLNELIRYGSTSTRVKGKNFRIKTPSCKALKKMNPDYQAKEGNVDLPLVSDTRRMKIPLYVTLELLPLSVAAWNQVSSIAHNPRLRMRLSVECQLSSIFSYLGKKWRPLSSRLYQLGSQCQVAKKTAVNHATPKPTCSSAWERMFCIRTPPESSVNTRIMVFQVSNNKTHCIVSYALRKCSLVQEKMPFICGSKLSNHSKINRAEDAVESVAEEIVNGAEPDATVSCLSSEEDYDCDSASEDMLKDRGDCQNISSTSPKSLNHTSVANAMSTTISLKVGTWAGNVEHSGVNTNTEGSAVNPLGQSPKPVVAQNISAQLLAAKDDACCNSTTLHPCPADTSLLLNESATNNGSHKRREQGTEGITEASPVEQLLETTEVAAGQTAEKVCLGSDCSSFSRVDSSNDHCDAADLVTDSVVIAHSTPDPPPQTELQTVESPDENNVKNNEFLNKRKQNNLILPNKLFQEAGPKKYQKGIKKNFTKTIQSWTAKNCRKTTIAEIYMILGKPSGFRLCYDWIKSSTREAEDCSSVDPTIVEHKSDFSEEVSFGNGLMALIQAARLSRYTADDPDSSTRVHDAKPQPAHKIKSKHAGTQCDIRKAEPKSAKQGSPVNPPSNPHGRGVSKVIPVETVLVGTGFAVPAVPTSGRHRKLAANNSEPMTTTLVSPETMEWLLRKDRSRNMWQSRKAMLGERAARIKPSSRSMKTFSIVTRGPNKVGFLPVVSYPTEKSRGAAFAASVSNCSTHSLDVEKFLGMDTVNTSDKVTHAESAKCNLLIRAAKEAGVAPSTPNKNDSVITKVDGTDIESSSSTNVSGPCGETRMNSEPALAEAQQNEDLLCEAFGERDPLTLSRSQISSAPTTLSPSALGMPLSQNSNAAETAIDPLLELSWSSNEVPHCTFSASGDSLMEKLNDEIFPLTNTLAGVSGSSQLTSPLISHPLKTILDENSRDSTLAKSTACKSPLADGSAKSHVHPWTINMSSLGGAGLCDLLNTPQKLISNDMEESTDGFAAEKASVKHGQPTSLCSKSDSAQNMTVKPTTGDPKCKLFSQEQSSNFLADTEVDLQLQCMLNENSVDYIAKFQDLVRQTEGDFDIAMVTDENADDCYHSSKDMQRSLVSKDN